MKALIETAKKRALEARKSAGARTGGGMTRTGGGGAIRTGGGGP